MFTLEVLYVEENGLDCRIVDHSRHRHGLLRSELLLDEYSDQWVVPAARSVQLSDRHLNLNPRIGGIWHVEENDVNCRIVGDSCVRHGLLRHSLWSELLLDECIDQRCVPAA